MKVRHETFNRFMTDAGVIFKKLKKSAFPAIFLQNCTNFNNRSILDKQNTVKNKSLTVPIHFSSPEPKAHR